MLCCGSHWQYWWLFQPIRPEASSTPSPGQWLALHKATPESSAEEYTTGPPPLVFLPLQWATANPCPGAPPWPADRSGSGSNGALLCPQAQCSWNLACALKIRAQSPSPVELPPCQNVLGAPPWQTPRLGEPNVGSELTPVYVPSSGLITLQCCMSSCPVVLLGLGCRALLGRCQLWWGCSTVTRDFGVYIEPASSWAPPFVL